jgi:AAA15 family ATPase/GTPase
MLSKIEIENFKCFNKNFIFDLSKTNSFNFNKECVKNGTVNKALIYGYNSVGKSNLALAIFDIVSHISDKKFALEKYNNYLNADNGTDMAKFKLEFQFDEDTLVYEYTKKDVETLVQEKVTINGSEYASIDRTQSNVFKTTAKGTESLNKDLKSSMISIVKYLDANSVLEENKDNKTFNKFMDFVNHMLLFRNLDDRFYIGLEEGSHSLEEDIVEQGNLKDFEKFLNDTGIKCKLKENERSTRKGIDFVFEKSNISFFEIASSGTISLILFYFWYQRLKREEERCSFLFIDEFDAFYHHTLSKVIIEKLKEITNTQVILTTHNTAIISNDLLRPDCYFLMYEDKITSLSNSTVKELREAHNIEKMYRAGSFE